MSHSGPPPISFIFHNIILSLEILDLCPFDLVLDVLNDLYQLISLVCDLLDVIVRHISEIKYSCCRLFLSYLRALKSLAFL